MGGQKPRAAFKTPITVEDVLNSRMIAYPLRLSQCCPGDRWRRPDPGDYKRTIVFYEAFPIHFCSSASGTLRPCRGRIWSTASLSRSMLSYRFTCAGLGCAGGVALGAAGV